MTRMTSGAEGHPPLSARRFPSRSRQAAPQRPPDAREPLPYEDDMKQCMDAEKLHRRIGKLIGQLKAIDQMIDRDVPCEDVLMQINAVKGALHKVGQIILEGHLQHCVCDGIEHGDADATIAAFAKAIDHFARRS